MGARRAKKPAAGAFCVRTPACRAGGIGEPFSGPAHCAKARKKTRGRGSPGAPPRETVRVHCYERRPGRTAMRDRRAHRHERQPKRSGKAVLHAGARKADPGLLTGGERQPKRAALRRLGRIHLCPERRAEAYLDRLRSVRADPRRHLSGGQIPPEERHLRARASHQHIQRARRRTPTGKGQHKNANTEMQTRKGNHEKTNTERQPQRRSAPKQNAAKKPAPKGAILLPFGAGMFVYGFGTRQFFSRPFSRYGQHVRKERAEISRTGSPCRRAGRPDGCKRYPARRGTGTR